MKRDGRAICGQFLILMTVRDNRDGIAIGGLAVRSGKFRVPSDNRRAPLLPLRAPPKLVASGPGRAPRSQGNHHAPL